MTKFRIVKRCWLDGRARYYVQQWRWFYWSDTYYWREGYVTYSNLEHLTSLEEAEDMLSRYIMDTKEKFMSKRENQVEIVVKEVEVNPSASV
jgi:hypothetical protein